MVEQQANRAFLEPQSYPLFKGGLVKGRSRLIDTSGDIWRIGDVNNSTINFKLIELCNPFLLDQLKYYLTECLKSWAPYTVVSYFNAIKRFMNGCSEISEDSNGEILRSELEDEIVRFFIANRNQGNEDLLNRVRAWYVKSEALNLPAFDEHVSLYLKGLRLKGNVKGLDVLIEMAGRGPLKTEELFYLKDLLQKHGDNFALDSSSYWRLVATWIFIVLGIRREQLRLLMESDFLIKTSKTGGKLYLLNVPSVKKHYSLPRTYFKRRQIPSFLGEKIESLISINRKSAQVRGLNFESIPIFMSSRGVRVEDGREGVLAYLFTDDAIGAAPQTLLEEINEIEREANGRPLNINLNSRRLRKTFATQAAAQGVPARILAELLDHEDMQHVMVYYEQTVAFTHKLDAVYRDAFGEIFEFFKGNITLEAVVNAHQEQVIYGPANLRKLLAIGYCGSDQRCSLAPPYSCYGCNKLQACDNKAVHQEVLANMIEEVNDLFQKNVTAGKYDSEHILACKQLIAQLEALE